MHDSSRQSVIEHTKASSTQSNSQTEDSLPVSQSLHGVGMMANTISNEYSRPEPIAADSSVSIKDIREVQMLSTSQTVVLGEAQRACSVC